MSDQAMYRAAQAWAAEQLGLEPESDVAQVRRAIWSHLAESGFGAHDSRIEAADVLLAGHGAMLAKTTDGPASNPAFQQGFEQSLATEIAEFEGQFFELNVLERQARWSSLADRTERFPPLHWRMHRLESGLSVDLFRFDGQNGKAGQVAEWCGELFVLGPKLRSTQKIEILSQLQDGGSKDLIDAARQICRYGRHPKLQPWRQTSFAELTHHKQLLRRRARQRRRLAFGAWWRVTRGRVICSAIILLIGWGI